jgi:hypothetical protein
MFGEAGCGGVCNELLVFTKAGALGTEDSLILSIQALHG